MFIVDSQIHVWKEETPDRPWVPGARERIRLNGHREDPFSYQEALELMDEAGVDRALILPPSWEGDRIDYALEACAEQARRGRRDDGRLRPEPARQRHPADVPPAAGPQLDDRRHQRLVLAARRGTRHQDDGARPDLEGRAGRDRGEAPAAQDHHRPHGHHGPLRRRRDRLLGQGDRRPARAPQHLRQGLGDPRLLHRAVPEPEHRQVRPRDGRRHGPRRCFWGTDVTRLLGHGLTWTDTVEQFTEHFGFTAEELDWIMGRGISECLDWPIPESGKLAPVAAVAESR